MKRIYILSVALTLTLSAFAQQLNKEIVIERDINPELRAVSRLNNYPTVVVPQIKANPLAFSDLTTSVAIPGMLTQLAPAASDEAVSLSPYKGYASLGYFPIFNLGASAGYQFINKPKTSLGMWMQYDGNAYNIENDMKLERNTVAVGADFSQLFSNVGRLDIKADYTFNSSNRPWLTEVHPANADWMSPDSTFNAHAVNAEAVWSAVKDRISYAVAAKYSYFGLDNREQNFRTTDALANGMAQSIYTAKAGATYNLNSVSDLSALVGVDVVNYNHFNSIEWLSLNAEQPFVRPSTLMPGDSRTMALITLAPSYRYYHKIFNVSVGLKAQVATNADKAFNIAPDIKAELHPWEYFRAELIIDGGRHINRLSSLYNINPYMSPSMSYLFSDCPLNTQLSLKGGPWRGFSIEIFGGYNFANDWLMPEFIATDVVAFMPVDLRAWNIGGAIEAKIGDLLTAKAKYTLNPGDYNHASYLNPDRAKQVVDVQLTVTPIDKLEIVGGFEWRHGRSIYAHLPVLAEGDYSFEHQQITLRNSNNLSLGARYAVFDWLSVFANVENIINNRAYEVWLHQQQGVKGLVGVAVKF